MVALPPAGNTSSRRTPEVGGVTEAGLRLQAVLVLLVGAVQLSVTPAVQPSLHTYRKVERQVSPH
jgi:hypothetical protein